MLRSGSALLAAAGVSSPESDADALLAHAWGIDSTRLHRHRLFDEVVPSRVLTGFAALIDQRAKRLPLQHLTGVAHFRYLELAVGPGVFVPRPETELLVDEVLSELARLTATGTASPLVVDLCSGSGAISLAVGTEAPTTRVLGIESSCSALDWSRQNLQQHPELTGRVEIRYGDATSVASDSPDLCGVVDIVVCNPPYVPNGQVPRDAEVRDHDPAAALYGGADGLEIPARIIAEVPRLLRSDGLFVMEHAEGQGAGVRDLIAATPHLHGALTLPDYTGRDRYTVARREHTAS